MMQTQNINRDEWTKLILGLTIFLSVILRFFPGLMAGFPLNDGGMFLVMLRELKTNHFLIPAFTSYNYSNIPFAYPPFGFYAGALLSVIGIPDLQILRWLPVLINILTIPAFFLFAETLLEDRPRAAIAAVFYALAPVYGWEIMGGGLTRSFGVLFMLLALHFAVRSFKIGSWQSVFLASLFGGLSVMSHPQTAIHAAFGIAFFWVFTKHSWKKLLQAFVLAVLAGVVCAPWWLTVYLQHGIAPFISAASSGVHDLSPLNVFVGDLFARDTFIPILMFLRVAGIIWEAAHRRFTLVLLAVLAYFLDQRSAGTTSFLAFSLLCGIGFADALPFVVNWLKNITTSTRHAEAQRDEASRSSLKEETLRYAQGDISKNFFQLRWLNPTLIVVMFYLFLECGVYSFVLVNTSLHTPAPFQAMQWVSENTPLNSRFLLLTGSSGIMTDPIQEWFPALAQRESQTTMQGLEWNLNKDFFPRLQSLITLQACTNLDCVNNWSANIGLSYDYLLIQKSNATLPLLNSVKLNMGYVQVYENSSIVIFQKR
ncbi:MAG: glycosyltransferase family 39 protein [Anaerolineales bacterium]